VWVATSIRAARGASCGLENRQTDMGGNKLGEVEANTEAEAIAKAAAANEFRTVASKLMAVRRVCPG
jgi:hypothetical protein